MSLFRISPMIAALAAVITLAGMTTPSAHADIDCFDQTGSSCRCPVCDHVCEFKAECKDIEQDGFDVESKVICIPRVMFPWQSSKKRSCLFPWKKSETGCCSTCPGPTCSQCNNGARLRRVCVLKEDSRTCPECQYSWKAKKKECVTCHSCATPDCDSVPMPPQESYWPHYEEAIPADGNWPPLMDHNPAVHGNMYDSPAEETVPEFAPVFVEPGK